MNEKTKLSQVYKLQVSVKRVDVFLDFDLGLADLPTCNLNARGDL